MVICCYYWLKLLVCQIFLYTQGSLGNISGRKMLSFYCSFQIGFQAIAEALGLAAVKAAVAITAIIAGGRLVSLRYFNF